MTNLHLKSKAVETLKTSGIANPTRLVRLIQDSIAFLQLDLSGLTVLTEAASGPYVVTPVIAALSGAKRVLALTSDSRYASSEVVTKQTRALEALCGLEGAVEIHTQRSLTLFSEADIVTNLGFVRPIDAQVVEAMKPTAVIPLMCEAWEFREGDVDLGRCRKKGILVMGTNEDYPGLDVFDYSGWLCMKMLFEAQIEIHKSQILLVSADKFGTVLEKRLTQAGAAVSLIPNLRGVSVQEMAEVDVMVVCDYGRRDQIIGPTGDIDAVELARLARSLTIIQFAGQIDLDGLLEAGLFVYPAHRLGPQRMALTLAELGSRPVIELHAAGLKVGEVASRIRHKNSIPCEAESIILRSCELAQCVKGKQ